MSVAGDCFAQEFSQALRASEVDVLDLEPPPPGLAKDRAARFGYGLFSARHGNVYFARQLRQLIEEAYGRHTPAEPVWERDGRYFDALRPSVEPVGLGSPDEVLAHRARHLVAVREMLESTDLFVYAFGLNEAWVHTESGTVYPTAPLTIAGDYDPEVFHWHVADYGETCEDFRTVLAMLREINPKMLILTMLSPVPGTATITNQHVLTANTRHKAMLRAAAGTICDEFEFVDYLPAYEMVATQLSNGSLFDENRRTVTHDGLMIAIQMFFDGHPELEAAAVRDPREAASPVSPERAGDGEMDAVCEDALLDAFAR